MSKPNPGGSNQVVGQNINRSTKTGKTQNTSYGTSGAGRGYAVTGSGGKK